ncbi:MAG TPA: hypothetical protein VG603_14700 [Chitinophagales bacterium]|nr:hypothetical protein [Chitinophagales bacterium]
MLAATRYNSKFFKADSRVNTGEKSSHVYTSRYHNEIVVNDIFVPAGQSINLGFTGFGQTILFPVVGNLPFMKNAEEEKTLSPGDIFSYTEQPGDIITIKNPYADDTINFLQIGLKTKQQTLLPEVSTINFTEKNCLVSAKGNAANIKAGIYDSRVKGTMKLDKDDGSVFAYIINGSFEIDGRLMEYRDGLFEWGLAETEFEALSATAILLLIDCS